MEFIENRCSECSFLSHTHTETLTSHRMKANLNLESKSLLNNAEFDGFCPELIHLNFRTPCTVYSIYTLASLTSISFNYLYLFYVFNLVRSITYFPFSEYK